MLTNITVTGEPQHSTLREYKRWFLVSFYTTLLLAGESTATILERFYIEKGGKSKWVIASVQSSGFPILLPLLFYSSKHAKLTHNPNNDSSKTKPSTLFPLYLFLGLMCAMIDLMYAYGISYLPLSTYALICASQLGFNAVFTFFINSQKFTTLILNSIVILTMSVSLLATTNEKSEDTKDVPRERQIIGFFCALAASATVSLHHSLVQLCFDKVIKRETFSTLLDMQFYPAIIASCSSIVGLLTSGDWRNLGVELKDFEKGSVSYIMTLLWIAMTWQIADIGMLGLIFEVSSLFSIVIGNLQLTITPILSVIFFHDKVYGVKVIAFLLSIWSFLSYIYQHYLDDKMAKEDKSDGGSKVSRGDEEI